MTRRRAWVAAGVAVVAAVVALAVSVLTAGDGGRGLPGGKAITATARIDPTTALFGDEITARIDIAVDRNRAHPDDVRVRTPFSPLEPVNRETHRWDAGRITYIRTAWTLRCLSRRCAQKQPTFAAGVGGAKGTYRRATAVPPAKVVYVGRPNRTLTLYWPTVEWLSRINQTEEATGSYFYHVDLVPPAVSYAVSPGHLLVYLTLALVVLVAVPVAIVRRRIVERRRAGAPAPEPEVAPLERALRLLELANADGDSAGRRRALELVAVELRRSGRDELSSEARTLAWQRPAPPADDAGELGARVRSTVGGNGASYA
ncbi:MAG TPA: hypothetical protein VE269_05120 [Gaiellaceae bacterium]|nr:hypothetical protein [Gaiellaceae bacterium]